MEIDPIIGNDEKVIVVEKYTVIDRDAGNMILEWKYDRRSYPKITLKGGKHAYSGDESNLMKVFKEGDRIIFPEIITQLKKTQRE